MPYSYFRIVMRIVFVSYHYSPDIHSPQEWVNRIQFYVGWLQCLAKEHTVIRVDQINYEGNFTHNGVQYFCVNAGKKKNYFPQKLNRFVKTLNPDIVVVSSFLFPLQVIQLRACLGKSVKIILQHHAEKPFTGIKKYAQRMAACKVDAFLFTARTIGIDWVKKGNLDTEKKVHESMEVSSVFYPVNSFIAKEKTNVTGSPVFLWVGRLNQNKDPLTVVNAFLKFTGLNPLARLYMIYHTDELLRNIKNLLPIDNSPVILVGKIEHSELLYWFNSADYFISASHYEGSGTALCEAMSCGCIPVVTDIPSFKKITEDGQYGYLFEPGNANSLYEALIKTDHTNSKLFSEKVSTHFMAALSFDSIAEKLSRLCKNLMAK